MPDEDGEGTYREAGSMGGATGDNAGGSGARALQDALGRTQIIGGGSEANNFGAGS